jgi:hypothetical protein
MVQPPHTSDLTTRDIFFFGFRKQKVRSVEIPGRERLKSETIPISGEIAPDVLISAFEE